MFMETVGRFAPWEKGGEGKLVFIKDRDGNKFTFNSEYHEIVSIDRLGRSGEWKSSDPDYYLSERFAVGSAIEVSLKRGASLSGESVLRGELAAFSEGHNGLPLIIVKTDTGGSVKYHGIYFDEIGAAKTTNEGEGAFFELGELYSR
jgi:hypothetical protein